MTWLPLAGGAAVLYALQGAWTKRLTRTITPWAATWAIFGFSFPLLALYLGIRGWPAVEAGFWPVLGVNVLLYFFSFRLYVSALEVGELGLTYPLLALTPVLVVPVEWILLGEGAGGVGILGIVLVAGGVYLLNVTAETDGLLDPLRAVARDPGCRRMLGVTALWAVSGTLDRAAVLDSSPAFYGAAVSLLLGLGFLPWAWRDEPADERGNPRPADDPGAADPAVEDATPEFGRADAVDGAGAGPAVPTETPDEVEADATPRSGVRRALGDAPGGLALQGMLFAGMFVSQMEALQLSLAAYVLTVKRSGTLLSVLLGGLLFREEALTRRLAGTVVVLVGVYLVATA